MPPIQDERWSLTAVAGILIEYHLAYWAFLNRFVTDDVVIAPLAASATFHPVSRLALREALVTLTQSANRAGAFSVDVEKTVESVVFKILLDDFQYVFWHVSPHCFRKV